MTRNLVLKDDENAFSEIFTKYLSDISLEIEAAKLRNMKSDEEGVNEHLARIDNALRGISDAKLEIAERVLNS